MLCFCWYLVWKYLKSIPTFCRCCCCCCYLSFVVYDYIEDIEFYVFINKTYIHVHVWCFMYIYEEINIYLFLQHSCSVLCVCIKYVVRWLRNKNITKKVWYLCGLSDFSRVPFSSIFANKIFNIKVNGETLISFYEIFVKLFAVCVYVYEGGFFLIWI